MSDTDIEATIKKYILFKKSPESEENNKDILYNKNLLVNYSKNFYFFSNNIVSLKNYNMDKIISNIIDKINFVFLRKDTILWKIGEISDYVYLIFLGEVNIYKPAEKNERRINMQLYSTLGKGHLVGYEYLKNYNDDKKTYLPRAKGNCILGKINIGDFTKIYRPILSEEINLINNFLNHINIFDSDYNGKFQKAMTLTYYKKNDYIFNQGDKYDTFYLIYRGTVRLYTYMKKIVKSKVGYDILKGKNTNERFTTSKQFEINGYYNELIKYNLIDASHGDFIGGIEYLEEFDTYKYSAKCLTNVVVLKVNTNLFNTVLIKNERKIFNEKIEKQKEFISKRMQDIKLGRQTFKLKDYILSKNKFVKTFLQSNPLSKKAEEKLDTLINCNVNPIKIKYNNNNLKTLNTSKNLLPKYIEEYKARKIQQKKMKKKNLKIKDFVTNIDYTKKYTIANIFPLIITEEIIPKSQKIIFKLKDEKSSNETKTITEPFIKERSTKKFKTFNYKSNKGVQTKITWKKDSSNKLFSNNRLKRHLTLDLRSKTDRKYFNAKRHLYKYKSFKK